ncbi:MAG: hypothetical protein WEC79_00040 [Thermomicrobiales bacterium]
MRGRWSRRLIAAAGLLALLVVPLLAVTPAQAFKPYTHTFASDRAWDDVVDDGMVTIDGREYTVNARVVTALELYPEFYRGGAIGPDGFPDFTYGQQVIHATETGKWMRYILDASWDAQTDLVNYPTEAERLQILAFGYGYLTHAAGDMWAHTLVNDLALGVFPGVTEILTEGDKAAIAIRHIIIEGYIGDVTNGFDGNPDRNAIGGDVSDDSTPGVTMDAPHNFVYRTLIDPAAPTPAAGRGAILNKFLDLRTTLVTELGQATPDPLQDAIDAYDDTIEAWDELESDCDFGANDSGAIDIGLDITHDLVWCPIGLFALGITVFIDSLEAFWELASGAVELAVDAVKDSYIKAWIADIDAGLLEWNRLGLAISRAIFDPQAYRNTQNNTCWPQGGENELDRIACEDGIGALDVLLHEADPFINDHLLSMAGFPDLVGDIREILQEIGVAFDYVSAIFDTLLNPITAVIDDIKEAVKQLVLDLIEEATKVDIELLKSFLTHPGYWLNVTDVTLDLPGLGPTTMTLFSEDDHEQLDAYMGLGANHHTGEWFLDQVESTRLTDDALFDEAGFGAFANTVTTAKLLLLDSSELNRALGDSLADQGILKSAASVVTYPATSQGAPTNVMYHALTGADPWLLTIDSDHSWRSNPLPIFCAIGSADCDFPGLDPLPRPLAQNAGNGQFPIWESCLLRPAFRDLYLDWENGALNFPDLNDPPSADASDPHAPEATLIPSGNIFISGGTTYVGSGHTLTLGATDTVFTTSSVNVEYRYYPDGTTPGAWQPLANGGTFAIPSDAGDGVWKVDYRSEDPCHTFVNESGTGTDPLAPEATKTLTYVLDTTAPVITITSPPAGSVFDTDDFSNIAYTVSDGGIGSGVASDAVTFDGDAATNGQQLDMFFLDPGVHTIVVSSVDNLGNASEETRLFEVHATAESLASNLTRAFEMDLLKNKGIYNSLHSKMQAADAAHDRGQHATEWNLLNAFVNQLEAQRGKGIDLTTANRFIAFALDLIAIGG